MLGTIGGWASSVDVTIRRGHLPFNGTEGGLKVRQIYEDSICRYVDRIWRPIKGAESPTHIKGNGTLPFLQDKVDDRVFAMMIDKALDALDFSAGEVL